MKQIMKDKEKGFMAISLSATSREDVLHQMAQYLYDQGYVKDSFEQAILQREANYPTGLPTESVGVAIPHADPEHVIQPATCLAILDKPVEFVVMGTESDTIEVSILFMLAIQKKEDHMELLPKLIDVCQSPETLQELLRGDQKVIGQVVNALY